MNSLDTVEAVMAFEEAVGVDLPAHEFGDFGTPWGMEDWLELHLSNQRLSKHAAALLRKLAKDQNNPELAEGLEGTWRREQIAAVVREIFRQLGIWALLLPVSSSELWMTEG
jgi:hypothetical protein